MTGQQQEEGRHPAPAIGAGRYREDGLARPADRWSQTRPEAQDNGESVQRTLANPAVVDLTGVVVGTGASVPPNQPSSHASRRRTTSAATTYQTRWLYSVDDLALRCLAVHPGMQLPACTIDIHPTGTRAVQIRSISQLRKIDWWRSRKRPGRATASAPLVTLTSVASRARPARTVPWSRPGGRCGPVGRARLDRRAAGRLGLLERGAVDLGVDEPHINHALYHWWPSWGSAAARPTSRRSRPPPDHLVAASRHR